LGIHREAAQAQQQQEKFVHNEVLTGKIRFLADYWLYTWYKYTKGYKTNWYKSDHLKIILISIKPFGKKPFGLTR
jgi:hypothetical protein